MTAPFVVDASITLAWCFRDEATPYAAAVRSLLRRSSAMAPSVWPLEIANAVLMGERRARLTRPEAEAALRLLAGLPITVDQLPVALAWGPVVVLARSQSLSAYDASYLELALRRGLALATQDTRLRDAATRVGVALVAPEP